MNLKDYLDNKQELEKQIQIVDNHIALIEPQINELRSSLRELKKERNVLLEKLERLNMTQTLDIIAIKRSRKHRYICQCRPKWRELSNATSKIKR